MKCNDCGNPVGKRQQSRRGDVCDGCWGNRLKYIQNLKQSTNEELRQIQKAMGEGNGKAKLLIDTVAGKANGDYSI